MTKIRKCTMNTTDKEQFAKAFNNHIEACVKIDDFKRELFELCKKHKAFLSKKVHSDCDDDSFRGEEWSFLFDAKNILSIDADFQEELNSFVVVDIGDVIAADISARMKTEFDKGSYRD